MNIPNIFKVLYIGVFSGILLGLVLKLIESLTHVRVYTLLLNVDFIPFIGSIMWGETLEFIFHVLISICTAFIFVYLAHQFHIGDSNPKLFLLSFIICLPTFPLYFLLSSLAIKEVPVWNDWSALSYWVLAHLIYVCILPILYKKVY
ncbi:hypothetical protein [Paenisporosarcina sp. TG20]|uniref:hypothetical protein n=1 Tax=Paenisporosarcina sp. TG20 TaxID=1211706 RepID=UPI000364F3E9|nr:hypothetical protein [Paenisporosarcina sp. TG20]